jgi:hypothetical protein
MPPKLGKFAKRFAAKRGVVAKAKLEKPKRGQPLLGMPIVTLVQPPPYKARKYK